MKHVCEVPNPKFEFVHRMTGVVGKEARNMLMRFIKEEQDNCWKWVPAEEVEDEEEIQSPVPGLKSVVVKLSDPVRNPRPRKEKRAPSPAPLDEPDDIMLEEPPRKVRITEAEPGLSLLQDLFCSSSSSESGSTICEMEDSCIGSEESNVTFQKQTEVREENMEEKSMTEQSEPNDKQENAKEDENVILSVECEKPTKSDAERQTVTEKGKDIKTDKKKEMIKKSKKEKSVKKLTEKEKSSDSKKDEQSDKNIEKEKYMKGKDQVKDKGNGQDKQSDRNKVNKGEKSKGAETLKGNKRDEKEKSRGNKSNNEKVKSDEHKKDNQENKDTEAVKLGNPKEIETKDEHKGNQIHQHKANEKQNDNEKDKHTGQTRLKENMRNENLGSEDQSSAVKGNQIETVEINEKCTETSSNTKTQSCEKRGKQMIVLKSKQAENERQIQLTQIEVKQAKSDKVIEKQKNVNVESKDEQNKSNKKQKDKQNEKRKESEDGEVVDLLGDKILEMNKSSLKEASNKENEKMNKKEEELCAAREKRRNKENGNSASGNGSKKITVEEYVKRKEKKIDDGNQKVEERMKEHLTNREAEQTAGSEKLKEVFTLDSIINEMTLTREGMQCLSPIRDLSPERNLESPLPVSEESDTEEISQEGLTQETITAVESINNSTLEMVYNQAGAVISNCAVGLVEELVLEAEIDNYVDKEADSLADYEFRKEEDRRKAEKQNRKRKYSEIVETESEEAVTELDEDLETLQKIQESKIMLDVGGVKFETSIVTLKRDPNSLFAKIFTNDSPVKPQGNTVFLDRDASHFRIILNYLRNGCQIVNVATLPRERRYLVELKEECRYYRLRGLRKIISKRLKHLQQIYGMEY